MIRSRSRWNGVRVTEGDSEKYRPRLACQSVAYGASQSCLFSSGDSVPILRAMSDVTLTSSAAKRIKAILEKQPGASLLRVSVEGGGCSGFSYKFDFAEAQNADDILIERDGAGVVIDEMSLEFLRGAEIDFTNELIGSAFRINNPNATAACGCGTSFSI